MILVQMSFSLLVSTIRKMNINFHVQNAEIYHSKVDDRIDQVPSNATDVKVIFSDNDLIVVDKPYNLLSAPGPNGSYNLATYLSKLYYIDNVDHMIAHRLDYATSGVIIYCRNEFVLKQLHKQFRERKIYKQYTALIHGIPQFSLEGEIDLPLGRHPILGPPYWSIDAIDGKPSITEWFVERASTVKNMTYIRLRPLTGRTHQLRVHLASIGHPIIGDFLYAPKEVFNMGHRLMLHAESIHFYHPTTKQHIGFRAQCPLYPLIH